MQMGQSWCYAILETVSNVEHKILLVSHNPFDDSYKLKFKDDVFILGWSRGEA